MHKILLSGVRGERKAPGEFRTSQNWIGGPNPGMAKFVPPPPEHLLEALNEFEKYLHRSHAEATPPLIECALVHYQFEAIHPFLDGNGRIGRLLIALLAIERGVLSYPVLYLSAYLEKHRDAYMEHLYALSCSGDWRPWLEFFLEGVALQAEDATQRAERLLDLQAKYLAQAPRANTRRLIELLMTNPFITVKAAAERLELSYPGAKSAVTDLIPSVLQTYGQPRKRGQVYVANELFEALTGGL
jgi:Fic family protein